MDFCEVCFDGYRPGRSIFLEKMVIGVIEDFEILVTSKEWRSVILPPSSTASKGLIGRFSSLNRLDDLLNCRVTSVNHYRPNNERVIQNEIILARMVFGNDVRSIRFECDGDVFGGCTYRFTDSRVIICRDHGPGRRKNDYVLVQSFSVPANRSFNVLHCVSLTESMNHLDQLQPWTPTRWAATFFDCAREICGAPQIIREPTSRWRGYLGLFGVFGEYQVHDLESQMDAVEPQMAKGDLTKTLFSSIWSSILSVCGLHTKVLPLDESKPDSHSDQSRLEGFKKEESRIDPKQQFILTWQARLMRTMIAELGGQCEVDDDKASLTSSITQIGVADDVMGKEAQSILDENEKNDADFESSHGAIIDNHIQNHDSAHSSPLTNH